jgi:hypothetical protein
MNYLYSDWSSYKKYVSNKNDDNKVNENVISTDPSIMSLINDYEDEKLFLPFTGNGYIGIAINSNKGLHAYHQKSLNLPVKYNPIAQISSDTLESKGKMT